VLFGTDSAVQSADSRVSTPAYFLCDLGHEFAGDGLNGRWGSRRAFDTNTIRLIKASAILQSTAQQQPYALRVLSCRERT
jgi:hypothetical protein